MSILLIGIATFVATFGGAAFGMWVARRLPPAHLTRDTRDAISVSMAIVGTLAALVLGLLLTQSSNAFAARADAVSGLSADIVRMDYMLKAYGPEAAGARDTLKRYAEQKARELSGGHIPVGTTPTLDTLETLSEQVVSLTPGNPSQQARQQQAEHVITQIADERWLLVEKMSTPVPTPFLILLVFWLSLLFASFGLFAPRNLTVLVSLVLCALAVSGGVYMIIELGSPTRGLVRTPVGPLVEAVRQLKSGSGARS